MAARAPLLSSLEEGVCGGGVGGVGGLGGLGGGLGCGGGVGGVGGWGGFKLHYHVGLDALLFGGEEGGAGRVWGKKREKQQGRTAYASTTGEGQGLRQRRGGQGLDGGG